MNETCAKCQHGVAWFKSVQMRSADEGETVFYECQVRLRASAVWLHAFGVPLTSVAGLRAQVEPEQLEQPVLAAAPTSSVHPPLTWGGGGVPAYFLCSPIAPAYILYFQMSNLFHCQILSFSELIYL